jgi:2-oxo-4-hydroxy-4-carboxy-5-ureidoimidazoline decarboxylase
LLANTEATCGEGDTTRRGRSSLVADLNALGEAEFARVLGAVFERSPWVARAAWSRRPFAGLDELHAAMVAAVRATAPARRMALVRAHPELAGGPAAPGRLTAESSREQAGAGLGHLPPAEREALAQLNRSYRERFGFPLVIFVAEQSPASILAAGRQRLARSPEQELETALGEIAKIARARLDVLARGTTPIPPGPRADGDPPA